MAEGITIHHLTHLTCRCGETTTTRTILEHGETESLGIPYTELGFTMPQGWSYNGCPKCRETKAS